MNKPKVSIIVPIYNVEKYLDRCMESLLNQTLSDIEIIMVDDGSPDRCPQMCDEYAKRDNRIKVIHKKNAGLGYARNSGLEIATGEYVAFVDSDDYVDVDMYERMVYEMEEAGADAVICSYKKVYNDEIKPVCICGFGENSTIMDACSDYIPNYIGTLPNSKAEQLYGYSVWNILYRHDIIKKSNVRFYSERIYVSEDILFNIDYMSKTKSILLYPKPFYNYCYNEESLTTKYKSDRIKGCVLLWKEVCKKIEGLSNQLPQHISLHTDRLLLNKALYTICDAIKAFGFKDAVKEVAYIMGHNALVEILTHYPINEMPLQQRVFYRLIQKRQALLLVLLYKCKQTVKSLHR